MRLEDEYEKRRATILEPLSARLRELLRDYCKDLPRVDSVAARAKGVSRFVAKANKKLRSGEAKYRDPINEIQDQVGARIVVFYLSDVEDVIKTVVNPYFRAVEQQRIIPEPDEAFGYVGRHFILFIPSEVQDPALAEDTPKFFELQVKTLFQHAWAEANHDLAYKPQTSLSDDQRRLIALTAAQAWGSDRMFDQLFAELADCDGPAR